eukprot:2522622-Rhodomonas_salina.2
MEHVRCQILLLCVEGSLLSPHSTAPLSSRRVSRCGTAGTSQRPALALSTPILPTQPVLRLSRTRLSSTALGCLPPR